MFTRIISFLPKLHKIIDNKTYHMNSKMTVHYERAVKFNY